jgi:hypothetical protein
MVTIRLLSIGVGVAACITPNMDRANVSAAWRSNHSPRAFTPSNETGSAER